jgi:DNA end-binding protein Ku
MARPVWKGHISFGLVSIPVVLYSGEQRSDLHFNLLDSRDHARVRYERVNEVTGEEVPWDRIVKGYEYEDGEYVILEDEDFQRADVEASKTVEIGGFVPADQIVATFYDKPYYLVPDRKGEKGYVLLREALREEGQVGIARVVIRTRQYLAALMPVDDALVLDLMRYQQELRDLSEYDLPQGSLEDYRISNREMEMARQLIASMATDWRPNEYRDEYRDTLLAWIRKKAEAGGALPTPAPEEDEAGTGGEVIDMMDLLRRSVQEQKGQRQRTAAAASRRSASKKAPRKKSSGRKAAGKKSSRRKSSSRKASGE